MVPARCVLLDRVPLSRNGKLDRRCLPDLDPAPAVDGEAAEDVPPVRRRLRELWEQALGHAPAEDADVFTEGADSLSAASVVGRLRRDGFDLTVQDVFTTPTIRALAHLAEQRQGRTARREAPGEARPAAASSPDSMPLAPSQRGIWFDTQLDPGSSAYNVVRAFEISGALDEAALRACVERLVARHDALRTSFPSPDGEPVQKIHPTPRITWAPPGDRVLQDLAERPFDVEEGPLIRAALSRTGGSRWLFAVGMHHLICDDVSLQVFFDELGQCYRALVAGTTPDLPALSYGFGDVTRRRLDAERHDDARDRLTAYWRTTLAGLPDGLGFPRRGAPRTVVPRWDWRVEPDRLAALMTRLRARGRTLPMAMLAAFAAALRDHTGRTDIVVAVPTAGRDLPETERVIGCLVNVVPVRVRLADEPDHDTLLDRVHQALVGAYVHQELPIGEIAAAAGHPGRLPWDACLNIAPDEATCPRLDGASVVPVALPTKATQYEIELEAARERGGLTLQLRLGPRLGDADGAELAACLIRHIEEWTRPPADRESVSTSEERIP
jgi:aryl carrier-like protein